MSLHEAQEPSGSQQRPISRTAPFKMFTSPNTSKPVLVVDLRTEARDIRADYTSTATSATVEKQASDHGTPTTALSVNEPLEEGVDIGHIAEEKGQPPSNPPSPSASESGPSTSFSSSTDSSDSSSSEATPIELIGIGDQQPRRTAPRTRPAEIARVLAAAKGPIRGPQRVVRTRLPIGPPTLGQSAGRKKRGRPIVSRTSRTPREQIRSRSTDETKRV